MRLPDPDVLAARLARLRTRLHAAAVDALAVTALPNIAYLTGFFASAGALVVAPDEVVLISDSRYAETLAQRQRDCPFVRAVELPPGQSYDEGLVRALRPLEGLRVGFDAAHLTVRRHQFLLGSLGRARWEPALIATDGVVEALRVRKDAWETACLRDGATRLAAVAKCILCNALAGRTEREVAADVEQELRRAGFERPAFDTIVAAGPNAARPHARASDRRIEAGELVVLDFGGVRDGYCTDMSRTVTAGQAGARAEELIARVAEAQDAAFAAVGVQVAPEDVDAAARGVLTRAGLGEAFTHGTGHGLGLELHEAPRLTRARPGHPEPPLAAGMVFTLEPGVYLPGFGGVRIEDDVLVTEHGAQWLTREHPTFP